MAKALGVGGVFFRARDPESLSAWYAGHLGIEMEGTYVPFLPTAMPEGGATVFAVFPDDTDYFAPSDQRHMINLVVDDLAGALQQVQAGGAELAGEAVDYPYGSFGWFLDPEGNKVELWQPKVAEEAPAD
jgi:predicted enzyme related to lactoylglutathione lyase